LQEENFFLANARGERPSVRRYPGTHTCKKKGAYSERGFLTKPKKCLATIHIIKKKWWRSRERKKWFPDRVPLSEGAAPSGAILAGVLMHVSPKLWGSTTHGGIGVGS